MKNWRDSLPDRGTKIILALMLWPVPAFVLGAVLADLLSCSAHDFRCSVSALNGLVTFCVFSPFLLYVTVPVGGVVLAIRSERAARESREDRAAERERQANRSAEPGTWLDIAVEPDPRPSALLSDRAVLINAPLEQTWIARLSLEGIERQGGMPLAPDWPCAIDRAHQVLFTRLADGPEQGPETEYLLAIESDVIIVTAQAGTVRVMPTGARQNYQRAMLADLATQGIATLARQAPRNQPPV